MDHRQFTPTNNYEFLLLEVAKSSQLVVETTHTKPQETKGLKMNSSSAHFRFDKSLE